MPKTPKDRSRSKGRGPWINWYCYGDSCFPYSNRSKSYRMNLSDGMRSAREHAMTHGDGTPVKLSSASGKHYGTYSFTAKNAPETGIGTEWSAAPTESTVDDNPYWFLPGAGD